jgi:hypothetical protein
MLHLGLLHGNVDSLMSTQQAIVNLSRRQIAAGQPRRVDEVWLSGQKRAQEATSEPTARHKQWVLFHLLQVPVLHEPLYTHPEGRLHMTQSTQGLFSKVAPGNPHGEILQVSALCAKISPSQQPSTAAGEKRKGRVATRNDHIRPW